MVKTLVDRLTKINNAWSGFHNDMEKSKPILQKNLFSSELIGKVVKKYLSDQYNSKESLNKKGERYLKLRHVVDFFLDTLTTK